MSIKNIFKLSTFLVLLFLTPTFAKAKFRQVNNISYIISTGLLDNFYVRTNIEYFCSATGQVGSYQVIRFKITEKKISDNSSHIWVSMSSASTGELIGDPELKFFGKTEVSFGYKSNNGWDKYTYNSLTHTLYQEGSHFKGYWSFSCEEKEY
jgi:hypothetical protein